MISSASIRRVGTAAALTAGLAAAASRTIAQTSGTPERFTAMAVNMSNVGRAGAGTIEIAVDRWSTDAERDRLVTTLMEKGPDKLLDVLKDTRRVGYIRSSSSLQLSPPSSLTSSVPSPRPAKSRPSPAASA